MKLFQAGVKLNTILGYHKIQPENKVNVLKSFSDKKNMSEFAITHRNKIGMFICDSGTWALTQSGGLKKDRINSVAHLGYLKRYGHHFDFYFNFDENFTEQGFEDNLYNQQMLEDAGLHPVPVIHNIYDDEIDYYIDKGYKHIALGSSQITSVKKMAYTMEKFKGSGIRVHLFGNSRFKFLSEFPIDSADTAMSIYTGSYGFVRYWNPKREGINKTDLIYLEERWTANLKKKGHLLGSYEFRKDFEKYLSDVFDLTIYDLLGPNKEECKEMVNMHYYFQLEKVINQIHQQKGFILEN